MSGELLLALDLGTTGVRALVVAPDGSTRARAYRPLAARYPQPGWIEQDPDELFTSSLDVLREALAAARIAPADVAALGVVAQRGTALAWDAQTGMALAPAQSWQDQRTSARVAGFRAAGIPISTLATAAKLEWWMEHEPRIADAARAKRLRFGTPDVWLAARLTGGEVFATEPGHAGCTALFDGVAGDWAQGLLDLFHVPREALPRLVKSAELVGETARGLFATPIRLGARAGDQQAAAFAQGVHRPGRAKLTLGTSAMLDVHTGDAPREAPPGAYALPLWSLPGRNTEFCLEGTVITAGSAVEWLVDLGVARDGADVSALAASAGSSGGVRFVPALQGLGTPIMNDHARGSLSGLSRGSGRAEIARAVLEGVAQRCADVCAALPLDSGALAVDGGLAQSDVLLQSLADFSGRSLARADEVETTALGAAFLAGIAAGVYRGPDDCSGLVRANARFEPRLAEPERAALRAAWQGAVALVTG